MSKIQTGRQRLVVLVAASALGATAPAAAQLVFANGFEPGEVCNWSSVATACVTEGDVASALTGLTLPVCVPRFSGSTFPYDYTLCPDQLCADGVTPGCQTAFHIVTATPDFTVPWVANDITGDDADLPFYIHDSISGGSDTCTLQLRSGTGTSDVPLGVATCFPGYLFGESAGPATTAMTVTMSIANTSSFCLTVSTLLPLVQGQILSGIENGAGAVCAAAVSDATGGRFLCAP